MVVKERPFLAHLSGDDSVFRGRGNHLERAQHAWARYEGGDYLGALGEYESLLPFYQDSADLLALIAATSFRLARFEQAADTLRKAVKLEPRDADLLNLLGAAMGSAGKFDEACRILKEARTIKPADVEILYNLALTLTLLTRYEEAFAIVEATLKKDHALRHDLEELRQDIVDANLRRLVQKRVISWSGGKPTGPATKIELSPGPPISQWIIDSRG